MGRHAPGRDRTTSALAALWLSAQTLALLLLGYMAHDGYTPPQAVATAPDQPHDGSL